MRDEWWKKAIIYQIYPKSFMDTDNNGIGDLKGIIQKLDYLTTLGVDALWLSPIYLSPQVDNGYDIADYRKIDPTFGTNGDMYELIHEAHARGLKIIMDMVANHTSDQATWFKESRKSKDNYFSNFYIWRDAKADGGVPNNWGSNFGGSAWKWDDERQQYYLHYYAEEQPDLNWENPLVRQYIYDMMRFWKSKGVDGWRMDVITSISKRQDFPDNPNPFNKPSVTANQDDGPRMHEFIHEMNQEVLTPFDMMSVGESPSSTSKNARLLVDPARKELDMIFTFEHMHVDRKEGGVNGRWDIQKMDLKKLKQVISNWQVNLRGHGWNSLYFENHDRARVVSRWGNDKEYRYESATAFATILHGLQGTPYIFQGEEIGMTNPDFDIEDYEDIELLDNYRELVVEQKTISKEDFLKAARKISRDNARTPMQWDETSNSGFTKGTAWFKLNPNYPEVNVKKDLKSKKSIFNFYQNLIKIRHESELLEKGTYHLLCPEDENIFSYERTFNDKVWLIIANISDNEFELADYLPSSFESKRLIIHNYNERKTVTGKLHPWEALIIEGSKH